MDQRFTLSGIDAIAASLWEEGRAHHVWAFHASMGTGKTTFIHALCKVLGVSGTVSSPTFAIINEYNSSQAGIVYHMDWYRLKDEEEAMNAGVDDCLRSGQLCLVEWPGQAEGLLPADTLHVHLQTVDEGWRHIYTRAER